MLTTKPRIVEALDLALVGFLTAVNAEGQPQTSPVWFARDGDDVIVYNKATSPRLASIASNSRIALTLRGDRRGNGLLTIEGTATVDSEIEPADRFTAYLQKYGHQIEKGLGYTPEEFADDYSVAIRIVVSRIRSWNIGEVIAAETA